MGRLIAGIWCALFAGAFAWAGDNTGQEREAQGYVFFAPGGATAGGRTDAVLHFGVGGEGLLYRGLGAGAEIGYVFPAAAPSWGVAVGSINALYQFGRPSATHKVVPFITGGWSVLFRGYVVNGVNLGGGATYWFNRRLGLRMEFRDHFPGRNPLAHFWEGRFGLSF